MTVDLELWMAIAAAFGYVGGLGLGGLFGYYFGYRAAIAKATLTR